MSRKNALVKGAGGYEIDNDATIQIKDRRPNRHEGVLRRTRGEKIVAKVTVFWAQARLEMGRTPDLPKISLCGARNVRSYPRHEQNYGQKTGVMYCIGRTLSKFSARRALTMMFVKAQCVRPSAVGFCEDVAAFQG